MVSLLYVCSVRMCASQGLSFLPENLLWGGKSPGSFFLMDKTIDSDLEVFTCFYANKLGYKFSRKLLQRNGRISGIALVITGLLI